MALVIQDPWKVSAIIPVYKGEAFIANAIESVLAQTYDNIEVIVVNDGSPDRSRSKIEPYLRDKRVLYVEQPNAGVASARNTALRHASGNWIGFCDQDDEWLPHKIESQLDFLNKHPNTAMIHSDVTYVDEAGRELPHLPDFPSKAEGMCFAEVFKGNPVMTVTALVNREIIEEVGGFDASIRYSDDYDLWLRIASRYSLGYIDEPLALYRLHCGNTSSNLIGMYSSALKVVNKNLRQLPRARRLVSRGLKNNRYYQLHHQLANLHWRARSFSRAVYHGLAAVRYRPLRAVWNSIERRRRNTLRWYWVRISGLFKS